MTNWNDFLKRDDIQNEIKKIESFLDEEREKFDGLLEVLPYKENIYKAFDLTDFDSMKVVLIGQDPYHNIVDNKAQAQGLCFSVPDNFPLPPSLKNIFKELCNDIKCDYPNNGDLTKWGEQGVLLLNRSLSVLQSKPNSHKKIWKYFSDELMKFIIEKKNFCIFICWGLEAEKSLKGLNLEKHIVLKATHPSPLGANKGGFFGCKHFSKVNEILRDKEITSIDWSLNNINQKK
tara:strand:- start:779 stop:1477 length:699 start_codon:yes stop_codon:yes gene_type:complete